MRIAIIGAAGQLGTALMRTFGSAPGCEVAGLTHSEMEVADAGVVARALAPLRPDVVINCAAFHRVDDCEDRPEEAFRVNTLGALHVARACANLGASAVYISTDYVFDGAKGGAYTEEDPPTPPNIYGASKLAGEVLTRQACQRWLVVRVASLFGPGGASSKGGSFLDRIVARARAGEPLRVVADMVMSPTYTPDAAAAIERLVAEGCTGVFHATNAGCCSWYEFAQEALAHLKISTSVIPVPSSEFPTRARRPRNSSLKGRAIPGFAMRPWQEALQDYLREHGCMEDER
ncbi:MAG: dTDP-4-dehydrorhamnose reductase [bacterium]|nr:dTDP-4-dehydrorhamnose reductase [bacterium]